MKSFWPLALVGVIVAVAFTCSSWAKDETRRESRPTTVAKSPDSPDIAIIRKTEATFKTAFDAGDAKALSALWTSDGEYVDENGRRIQGREAIAKEYTEFFAANPGIRITSHIDSIRLINAETAIEDGTAAVNPSPAGAPTKSRYTVVHVKRGDKWLMCSVRDARIEMPSERTHLQDLNGMIGTWTSENKGVEFQVTCRWIADKKFVEQSFESHKGAQVVSSGRQIVGWDPVRRKITSWMFTSDGGHAEGVWSPHENGWMVEAEGVLADGTPTRAVNITSKLDDNAIAWRSVNRTAGAFRILDTEEVILKRVKSEHARK